MKKILILLAALLVPGWGQAGIAQDPLFIKAQASPRVLLVVSRDHQLFIKAYTDYTDLDGDGEIDSTFKGHIQYDGYFNPRKCYTYNSTDGRFEPSVAAKHDGDVTVNVKSGDKTTAKNFPVYTCSSAWSGNFLNWATMTRMDLVRKVLYGGYRSTDNGPGDDPANRTVLARAHVPDDVHAFVKVFEPAGATDAEKKATMAKYTPYANETVISLCNTTRDGDRSKDSNNDPQIFVARNAYREWSASESTVGDTGQCQPSAISAADALGMAVSAPLIAKVVVCNDVGGKDTIHGPGPRCKTYLNHATKKPVGILQLYGDPDSTAGLRFGLMTGSWAKNKDGGVLRKNVGLLANNAAKEIATVDCSTPSNGENTDDEINFCTGQFVNNQKHGMSGANALPAWGGVIGTLNRFRISGYKRSNYAETNCGSSGILEFSNGECADWGNPLSEMYLEALRYLNAGDATNKSSTDPSAASPTTDFDALDSGYIKGLPQLTWKDPIPAREWCAKSNVVVLSTGLNSFDSDKTAQSFSGWKNTTELTNMVADAEHQNLSGSYLIGSNNGVFTPDATCSQKSLGNFSDFLGICPEVPNLGGSYHIAGLALGTSLHDLRPGYQAKRRALWGVKSDAAARQPISTYTVALAESMPEFTFPVGKGSITLVPTLHARTIKDGVAQPWQSGSIADLFVLPGSTPTKGAIRVVWENSAWGSDYDQDAVHLLRYCVGDACVGYSNFSGTPDSGKLYIKLALMATSASRDMKHGYALTGATVSGQVDVVNGENADQDGDGNRDDFVYNKDNEFTRPAKSDWTYTDDAGAVQSDPVWRSFSPSADGQARLLKNPLWYTARYAAGASWDVKTNEDRSPGADGIPDNFFQVRNPSGLDAALSAALSESQGNASSAAAVAASSTRLQDDNFIYQARFRSADWSGQLLAYPITAAGAVGALAWDAAASDKIPEAGARQIYSFSRTATTKGINLTWGNLPGAMKSGLDNTAATADPAVAASDILNYLRGNQDKEQLVRGIPDSNGVRVYRKREASVFGDIINADPVFVGNQNFGYGSIPTIIGYDTYHDFALTKLNDESKVRNPLVIVNANDGMMHAIDGNNGNEIFTYVPSWLLCADQSADGASCDAGANSSPLRALTSPDYQHRYMLDGSLTVGDAYIDTSGTAAGASWKTVVVGAAAAGGKGIFALDLTSTFTGSTATTKASTLDNTQAAYANVTAAKVALWEFTDQDYDATAGQDGDADLGYTFGQPIVGRAADGNWVAIFANGYGSAGGKAVLYVVNLATGKLIRKIVVDDGVAGSNGLSSPAAIFNSSTGAFSTVFAGDLKGNLWKFDLSDPEPAKWDSAFKGTGSPKPPLPLFVARDDAGTAQPITATVEIGAHSAGGNMIYFGTGKYFETADGSSSSQQTLYAIRDNEMIPDASTNTAARKRTVLKEHSIEYQGDNPFLSGTEEIRVTDDVGAVSYSGGNAIKGWYLNLQYGNTKVGERVVSTPILRNRRIIFTTIVPNLSPCEFGGTSWIMEFDSMSGNRLNEQVLDINRDGDFTSSEYVSYTKGDKEVKAPANGIKSDEGMTKSPAIIAGGSKEYKISSGSTGNVQVVVEKGSTLRARTSWRQIR